MATTIQLKETTKQLLDNLKTKEKIESYDIIIQHLLKTHVDVSDMFGHFHFEIFVYCRYFCDSYSNEIGDDTSNIRY